MSQALSQSDGWYEVEAIIDDRFTDGYKEYLIRWHGYSSKEDEWVNLQYIRAYELVREYEQAKRQKRRIKRYQSCTSDADNDDANSSSSSDISTFPSSDSSVSSCSETSNISCSSTEDNQPSSKRQKLSPIKKVRLKMSKHTIHRCRHFLSAVYDLVNHIIVHGPVEFLKQAVGDRSMLGPLLQEWSDFLQAGDVAELTQYVMEHLDDSYLVTCYHLQLGETVSVGARVHLTVGVLICVASCYYTSNLGDLFISHLNYRLVDLVRRKHYGPRDTRMLDAEEYTTSAREVKHLRGVLDHYLPSSHPCTCGHCVELASRAVEESQVQDDEGD